MRQNQPVVRDRYGRLMNARRLLVKEVPVFGKDFFAALVASVVLIANIFSFAALMFPGELAVGIPIAIWAMLIGSCVSGCRIAWATSIPPLATGIDSPTGVVLVLLSSAAASRVYAEGGAAEAAVQNVMLIFTLTTFIAGALLYSLGVFRWGSYFRFVPYFVVGGFLAATGWFLVAGGVRMMRGRPLDVASLYKITWTPIEIAKFAYAITTAIVLLSLRAWIKSSFAMPLVLLLMWLAGTLSLLALGLTDPEEGWYFPSLGSVVRWSPFAATLVTVPDWRMTTWLLPEMLAVVVVAVVSLVAKVTSLEVARQTSGDLNQEFRAHGIASLIAAPIGGLISNLQIGTSRLLDQAGGGTRMSGVICALIIGNGRACEFRFAGTDSHPHRRRPCLLSRLYLHCRSLLAPFCSACLVRPIASFRNYARVRGIRLSDRHSGWCSLCLSAFRNQLCARGSCASACNASRVCQQRRPLSRGVGVSPQRR
jgi:sulfate permease, SulP family